MSDIHIDDFYRDAAKILVNLYGHFPRKTTLFVEDISGPDQPDEFGLHSPRHQACLHAMLWLHQTDYLAYEQLVRQEAIDQAVLTHRGFLLLNSPMAVPSIDEQTLPAAVVREESLVAHRLRHELKAGNSFRLAEVMREIMARSRQLGDTITLKS